jgi:hypothetical protein
MLVWRDVHLLSVFVSTFLRRVDFRLGLPQPSDFVRPGLGRPEIVNEQRIETWRDTSSHDIVCSGRLQQVRDCSTVNCVSLFRFYPWML